MLTRVAIFVCTSVLVLGSFANAAAAVPSGPERAVAAVTSTAGKQRTGPIGGAALAALQRALGSRSTTLSVIQRLSSDVLSLPRSAFTEAQWAARLRIYQLEAARLIRAASFRVDLTLLQPRQVLAGAARGTAESATGGLSKVNSRFLDDLAVVTQEAAVSIACATILDVLAPDERPTVQGKEESDLREIFEQAVVKLVVRGWDRASVVNAVNWAYYGAGINEDAEQFLAAANGTSLFRVAYVATRPPASRALWVYARTCYSIKRVPGP